MVCGVAGKRNRKKGGGKEDVECNSRPAVVRAGRVRTPSSGRPGWQGKRVRKKSGDR